MKKRLGFLTLSLLGICVLGLFLAGPSVRAHDDGDRFGLLKNIRFAQRVAGTYVGSGDTEGGDPFLVTYTVNADGTYGGTIPAADGFHSTERGSWERIGFREIAVTSLIYNFDAEGALEFLLRVRGIVSFSREFNDATATFEIDIFLPGQDPLSDDPIAIDTGTNSTRRLHVME